MQESYNELGGVRAKGPVRQRTLKESAGKLQRTGGRNSQGPVRRRPLNKMLESSNGLGGVSQGPVRRRPVKEMQESSNGLGGVIAKDQSAEDP
jgi:hypothetical protein